MSRPTTIPTGSSPHTRGARLIASWWAFRSGIIPAYAGSTDEFFPSPPKSRDHPRIRGEHRRVKTIGVMTAGSSPHTRGARPRGRDELADTRIIPAYAGSTSCLIIQVYTTADHPRIRGEHPAPAATGSHRVGSSPHTRGALFTCLFCLIMFRIIPAYAGSTDHRDLQPERRRDHPRIRGEHGLLGHAHLSAQGSSPHTRGAPVIVPTPGGLVGIIPAYAGSTPEDSRMPVRAPDHPRIRGEHPGLGQWSRRDTGSSPHTRGAHHSRGAASAAPRIIPAYAGSTRP